MNSTSMEQIGSAEANALAAGSEYDSEAPPFVVMMVQPATSNNGAVVNAENVAAMADPMQNGPPPTSQGTDHDNAPEGNDQTGQNDDPAAESRPHRRRSRGTRSGTQRVGVATRAQCMCPMDMEHNG